MTAMIDISNAEKTFTMHLQGGVQLPVVHGVSFQVKAGECVVLSGPSGAGKSSILKMIFGNYRCDAGRIGIRHQGVQIDLARAEPRQILSVRRATIGYVSQFLRAVPRVATIDVVAEPLVVNGMARAEARERAGGLLRRLNIPERLWTLPPSTFSGGEQQRVNIARGFISDLPVLLLDEPTAFLDLKHALGIYEILRRLNRDRGLTVLTVSHDLNLAARFVSRLLLLHHGRLWADGTPREGLRPDRIREVYETEADVTLDPATGAPLVLPRAATDGPTLPENRR